LISRLKQARLEADLTLVEAGKKIGKTHSYISKLESGKYRVNVGVLRQLAKLYGKPLRFFLSDWEEATKKT
jgi:transcriptional regulator with XRE-family HTH domain